MMFTNVFRIGGLQTVSWFQLILDESSLSRKSLDDEDALTKELLVAHIQLQNEGRLSSWTFSSQAKGPKIKLWLFIPGTSRPSLEHGLKVFKSGLWSCPGNSSEVTSALCQALRNRFERALSAFAYVRFGGMFVKCKRYNSDDTDFRRTLPSCEATFSASEEGIFVHLRVRRRRMRPLAASDVRAVLTQHLSSSSNTLDNPAVVVAPYGLTGWLTGCFPGDFVRQLSQSKLETSKECSIRNSFPQATVKNAGFMSRSWYVEIRMKFLLAPRAFATKGDTRQHQWIEKAFIFPSESVLVPTVPPVAARTYLKRCWLRKLAGTDWLEDALSLKGFSPITSIPGYRLQAMGKSNTIWKLNSNSSKSTTSSGSGGSSIKSSDSRGSSGSESDVNDDGEYREDADSAATMAARHGTRISSNVQASDVDLKRTGKRGRENANDIGGNFRGVRRSPEIISSAANNTTFESSSVPGSKSVPSQAGTPWEWNENLQNDADIFAEFGDFGDFFEGDGLVFGEPPGTAESHMFPFDGDGSNTPGTQFDTSDPMRMPILDFPMLDGLGEEEEEQDPGMVVDAKCDGDVVVSAIIPGGPSLVAKSEAYIFATDYAPVEMREVQQKLDREAAYKPKARKAATMSQTGYVYGPNPPPTPKLDSYERKPDSRWTDEERRTNGLQYGDVLADHPPEVRQTADGKQLQSSSSSSRCIERQPAVLATDLECALFQVQLHSVKGIAFCARPDEPKKLAETSHRECVSEITDSSDAGDSLLKRQADKKKVPERIAGDADEMISHDGPRPVEIGVWRPVGLPKQQKPSESIGTSEIGSNELADATMQEMLDILPLVVQQAACSNDITLNGDNGDGPLAWLTLHQKLCRQTSMEHVSDLCDPSVTEISPATVASVLQSDMRQAMSVAFSDIHVSGPLSLAEWCRGKAKFDNTDIYAGASDSKDLVSSITGEPITPPQSSKVVSLQDLDNHVPEFRRSSREADDVSQKRMSTEDEMPSYAILPVPTILLGYQEDWLKTAPKSLRYWEKAPFEPYGYPKPVTYYVVCLALDSLLFSALEFFQQLSSVYEACKLGTHIPANVSAQSVKKRALPGFVTVEVASKLKSGFSSWSTANNYISAMASGWDVSEFRKSLRRVCKSLPVTQSAASDADYENSPSTVIYVVSPTAEPSTVLQTLMESCQGLGPNLGIRKNKEDGKQSVTGFSIGRLALQVVTAETVIRLNSSPAASTDVLKEVAFAVYNKLRRIPYKSSYGEEAQMSALSTKTRIGVQAGLWKESGGLSVLGRDSLLWPSSRLLDTTSPGQSSQQPLRLLYEPIYVLAENCLLDHSPGQLSKGRPDDSTVIQNTFGLTDNASEGESAQPPSFHCCYSWTRNWHWLISVWTDSRGKMLDVKLFPAPRCASDKDVCSKELFQLFGQIMHQGQQLRVPGSKVQNVVITRIGEFYETEYQEWQRILMTNGADEPRPWTTIIRPDGSDNLLTGQQRNVSGFAGLPSSPGASSSFASRGLLTGFSKAEQSIFSLKVNQGLQWFQNVTLASLTDEDSLQVLSLADTSGSWSSANSTGFGMAKTIASLNGAYMFVPAHGLRSLPSAECQASKAEVPAFGQWIRSRGPVSPVSSGYVISGPTTAMRTEPAQASTEEEWPSTLHIGLIAHFGCSAKLVSTRQEPGIRLGGNGLCEPGKVGVGGFAEARGVLERLAAEYYGLSWLTVSPMYLYRRLALPFHCDVAERLDKLTTYIETELVNQQQQQ